MKNRLHFLMVSIAIAILQSCGTHRISTINYDAHNQKVTFSNDQNQMVDSRKAHVQEGDFVNLIVDSINPITEEISINLREPVTFFTQSPSPFLTALNTDGVSKEDGGDIEKSDTAADKIKGKIKPVTNPTEAKITKVILEYKRFQNILSDFSFQYEVLKNLPYLNQNCICNIFTTVKNSIDEKLSEYVPTIKLENCYIPLSCTGAYSSGDLKQIQKKLIDKMNEVKSSVKDQSTKNTRYYMELDTLLKDYSVKYETLMNTVINEYGQLQYVEFTQIYYNQPVGNTDEFNINVSIKNTVRNKSLTYAIYIPVRKFIKIDFSAGVFYTGLRNQSFEKQKLDDSTYQINPFDESKFSFGPMGVINFHTFVSPTFKAGLFVGSGLVFNDKTKVIFSLGGSILIGKYQRMILHAGVSLAQVNRISSMYNGQPFKDAAYVPQTIQKWDNSFLVGLTWNLTNK